MSFIKHSNLSPKKVMIDTNPESLLSEETNEMCSSSEKCTSCAETVQISFHDELTDSETDLEDEYKLHSEQEDEFIFESFKRTQETAKVERPRIASTGAMNKLKADVATPPFTLNEEYISKLEEVKRHSVEIAKFIPSLAKAIKEETKSKMDCKRPTQMQARIIDHLEEFIYKKALPAIEDLNKLQDWFYTEAMNTNQELDFLSRRTSWLEAEMEDANRAKIEAEKWIEHLLTGCPRQHLMYAKIKQMDYNQCQIRGQSDLDRCMLEALTSQLSETQTKLNSVLQDVDKHAFEKEQLLDIMRTWNERLKKYEHERDIAQSGKVACEKKIEEVQEKIEDIGRIRSESETLWADNAVQHDQEDWDLVAGEWEFESERRFNDHSLCCNTSNLKQELEECQESKLLYLDESSSAEERTTCESFVRQYFVKQVNVAAVIEDGSGSALERRLVHSKNGNLNIWETSSDKSNDTRRISSKALSLPCMARKQFRVDKRVRSKAIRTMYVDTRDPWPQPITAKGTKTFQETLTLFRKLEMANPKRPRSLVKNMLPMLNKNGLHETGMRKVHFLNTNFKGYLKVTESTNVSADLTQIFGHTFYFCLGILPETTNTNPKEPFWTKDKSKDCCRPCLFWFENEDKYKTLQNETKSMNVRTRGFQMCFSQLALGIIVITPNSAVDSNKEDAVARLCIHSKASTHATIKAQREELLSTRVWTKTDFVVVTKLEEGQMFESHSFRAESEAETEMWIFNIRRFLTRTRLRNEQLLATKSPDRSRLGAESSSFIFCENVNVRGCSIDDRTEHITNLKASGEKEDINITKELKPLSRSPFGSDDDTLANFSLNSRPAVGELAKAFNRKASKLKQEHRRASLRAIDPDRKVRRRSQLFTWKESVRRLHKSRKPLASNDNVPMGKSNTERRATVPTIEDRVDYRS